MALPQAARWIGELRDSLEAARLFLVPRGSVILWHGASDAIPKGWALCDGKQGTPDLRDRFVIGAGGKYGLEATGGSESTTPEVSLGTARTGISLATAAPKGTAGKETAGISVQNASVSVTTGSAKTGITAQNATLSENTLPSHPHSVWGVTNTTRQGYCQNVHTGLVGRYQDDARERGWVLSGNDGQYLVGAKGGSQAHGHSLTDPGHTHSASAWQHGHGVTDPGHTHAVTTTAHSHTLTDGGHSHTVTVKALKTVPPYVALFYIKKL